MKFWHERIDLSILVREPHGIWKGFHALPKVCRPLASNVIRYVQGSDGRVLDGREEEIIHIDVPDE